MDGFVNICDSSEKTVKNMITSLEFIEVIFQFATLTFTDMINIGLKGIFPAENAREATVVKH